MITGEACMGPPGMLERYTCAVLPSVARYSRGFDADASTPWLPQTYGRIYLTAYHYVCNTRIASGLEYGVFDSKLAFWVFSGFLNALHRIQRP